METKHAQQLTSVNIGVINPGRAGLSNFGTGQILWWRLWEIAWTAVDLGLHLVILSSPRLPAGTRFPDNFPYAFEGIRTTDYNTVAVLISHEIRAAVEFLPDFGGTSRLWFVLRPQKSQDKWAVCAVTGPPGGDKTFWSTLLVERQTIMSKLGVRRTCIAGDCNFHIRSLVEHNRVCNCSHCHLSSVDRSIAAQLSLAGLSAKNPTGVPTHISGTVIDLFLSETHGVFPQVIVLPPGQVALSDHGLVHTSLPMNIEYSLSQGFGRVW